MVGTKVQIKVSKHLSSNFQTTAEWNLKDFCCGLVLRSLTQSRVQMVAQARALT